MRVDTPRLISTLSRQRDWLRIMQPTEGQRLFSPWRFAQQQGWSFHIVDESRVRGLTLDNIRTRSRYERMDFPCKESRLILETVQQMGCTTIDSLLARYFMGENRSEGVSHIRHLLATRQLDCDITRPLDELTEMWVPNHE